MFKVGDFVYAKDRAWGVFKVSHVSPGGTCTAVSWPSDDPLLRIEDGGEGTELWPALPQWYGRRIGSARALMASPRTMAEAGIDEGDPGVVVLLNRGGEFLTGLVWGRDGDSPLEWTNGQYVGSDLGFAIGLLRVRAGYAD